MGQRNNLRLTRFSYAVRNPGMGSSGVNIKEWEAGLDGIFMLCGFFVWAVEKCEVWGLY